MIDAATNFSQSLLVALDPSNHIDTYIYDNIKHL